jgi:hypothetical protein
LPRASDVRILLDECVDRRLARDITGHVVATVPEMGWAGRRNGELLSLAVDHFDVFITSDRNLPSQQDLTEFDIAVVVLAGRSNRLEDLRLLLPRLLQALPSVLRRQATSIS